MTPATYRLMKPRRKSPLEKEESFYDIFRKFIRMEEKKRKKAWIECSILWQGVRLKASMNFEEACLVAHAFGMVSEGALVENYISLPPIEACILYLFSLDEGEREDKITIFGGMYAEALRRARKREEQDDFLDLRGMFGNVLFYPGALVRVSEIASVNVVSYFETPATPIKLLGPHPRPEKFWCVEIGLRSGQIVRSLSQRDGRLYHRKSVFDCARRLRELLMEGGI